MGDVGLEAFEELQMKDALIVVAFPTTGSASSIAARYLVQSLELPLVGHLVAEDLPGVTAVHQGIATTPIRLYGGEVACRLDEHCPRVYLIMTDLVLPPAVTQDLGRAILRIAADQGASLVLALEGVGREEGDDTPDVYCAATEQATLAKLQKTGVENVPQALISGIAAVLLLGARRAKTPVGALVVEAAEGHPDGRAAAALIEALDELVPHVDVDHEPLLQEALELEAEIKKAQRAAEAATPKRPPSTFI